MTGFASCGVACVRECDGPDALQAPRLCCDAGEPVSWEGKPALHLGDSLEWGGISPLASARTQTSTAGGRTCMKGAGFFCSGVVPERINFSLRALKTDRKGKCHCGKNFFRSSRGSWHP